MLRGQELEQALRLMVHRLPPKERAALVLKDVLEFSLREIAGIIDSTEGGVKAALHRGRGKLADAQHQPAPEPSRLEGAPVLAVDRLERGRWGLFSLIPLDLRQGRVAGVRDYLHVPRYLFEEMEGAV